MTSTTNNRQIQHPLLSLQLEWLPGTSTVRSAIIWRVDGVAVVWLDSFDC